MEGFTTHTLIFCLNNCPAYERTFTHLPCNTQSAFISVLGIIVIVITIALTPLTSETEVQNSSRPSLMSGTTYYYVITVMADTAAATVGASPK